MSSKKQKMIADSLFGVQVICTLIFGGGQFLQMLTSTQGVSLSWFVFWEVFLVLNLVLAVRAHRNQPSRVTRQTIVSYVLWTAVIALDLGAILWKSTGMWNERDTATAVIALVGIVGTLTVAYYNRLTITDPIVKGYLAVFFKAVPQLVLAYNMLVLGSDGLAGEAIIAGHITILTRLGQLWFSIKEAGWDRNRMGSAISEIANQGSWIIVTIIWLMVQ
jgi:energy-converting hydrogenase Eha subunit A